MSQVIRVSRQGVDALGTAGTVPNNLIFDSNLNTFKILLSGTTATSVPTSGTTKTVAHSQSGVPTIFSFCKFGDGKTCLPDSVQASTDAIRWAVEVDSTNMYFIFTNSSGTAGTADISYYVFEAPL